MHSKRASRGLLGILLLVSLAWLVTGCQPTAIRSEHTVRDWSRGKVVGKAALNDRVALATDAPGDNVYLVWVAERETNGPEALHFVHLDRAGRVLVEGELPIAVDRPNQVTFCVDQKNQLHLMWIDRREGIYQLLYVHLDQDGQPSAAPQVVSLPEAPVENYSMALDNADHLDVFWCAKEGSKAGLYHLQLDEAGQILAANRNLGRKGFDPTFRMDRNSVLHLAWLEEPSTGEREIYYATFDQQTRALANVTKIEALPLPLGMNLNRLALGLGDGEVYIFWAVERRGGGMSQPMAEAFYVSFPLGQSAAGGTPQPVSIPPLSHPQYARVASGYGIHELASHEVYPLSAQFVYLPWTIQGHRDELVTVFAVQILTQNKTMMPIVLTVWAKGQMKGYQIAGQTRGISQKPVIQVDARNDLHLAWVDAAGFGVYDVYYAGTSAEARSNLNRVTPQDVLTGVSDFFWGVMQSLSFFPIVILWAILPLMLIGVYTFIRAEGDLAYLGSRLMLGIAIFIYMAFKYLFKPTWLAALPLLGVLPPGLADLAAYGVPLLVSGLAGVVTWLCARRRDAVSILPVFGLFVGADALLTLLIYVPGMVAE
jgi:hypothetical protein